MTELSAQQGEALEKIKEWFGGCLSTEPFRLFGHAGTGKTTLARHVPEALVLAGQRLDQFDEPVQYGAYTGKAASVLRGKGCSPASTLHSLVYIPMANAETLANLRAAREELDEWRAMPEGDDPLAEQEHEQMLEMEVEQLERESKTIGFEWNPDSVLAGAPLLILDEVSMVDAKLAGDIERFNVPVLVLGDPEQLEPVGGEGYYTNAAPDYLLTEIHRQALDSPVLALAERIRAGRRLSEGEMAPRSLALAMEHDQILCWRNATRWSMTNRIRAALGRPAGVVVAGDRIMCLTNNRNMGVFNGQQFDVLEAESGALGPRLTVRDDMGVMRELLAFSDGFEGQRRQEAAKANYLGGKGSRGLFTFANVITVHKAQGSEWRSVYVVNESGGVAAKSGPETARRWLYTAISRASEKITVSLP